MARQAWILGLWTLALAGLLSLPTLDATAKDPKDKGKDGSAAKAEEEPKDIADVPHEDRVVGKDKHKRYFFIGDTKKAPTAGHGLLVVMPGGGGGAGFRSFVKRMYKNAFKAKGYVVAQPVSVKWTPKQFTIWPTAKSKVKKMKFTTEAFVEAVIKDVSSKLKINKKRIYTVTWSSSGPAAYAISLTSKKVRGSLIAMSVFKPHELPSLKKAKGHAYYVLHSEADKTCPYRMAKEAETSLAKKGAKITLVDYEGGHTWPMPVYPALTKGLTWLEKSSK